MEESATHVHVIASGNDLEHDKPYIEAIIETVHKSNTIVVRDWLQAAITRKKRDPDVEKADWVSIVNDSIDAIKRADLVIAEISLADFNQGIQTYISAQYKKPTLVVTRSDIDGHFISGIANQYLKIEQYETRDQLEKLVTSFIQQQTVPPKDLRFNIILNRRIAKYLRDKSYETGKNKSEIIRDLIEKKIR